MFTRFIHAHYGRPPRDLTAVLDGVNAAGSGRDPLQDRSGSLVTRLAIAREAAARTLGERPHDTQVLGAAALATGRVVEMLTGEGKTLTAAMAVYALSGNGGGVHVVTANDYLAARDATWMAPLYRELGLTVGVTTPVSSPAEKRAAYKGDVTYGTAREFAFDYLRDTLAVRPDDRVQGGHDAVLIDEIDFVLLDEARVPFVITRATAVDGDGLVAAARLVAALDPAADFHIDEAQRTTWLTEAGIDRVEATIGSGAMDDPDSLAAANVQTALRARCTVRRDRDYVVNGDRVDIVDEFTGRILPGRRWADGLHQAVEAKEGVPIREDSQALAQVTARSYFERYDRIVGMSGTVVVAAREFRESYGVEVVALRPHRPVVRRDQPDVIFATAGAKYDAVVEEIARRNSTGQPILIGTATVEHSEYLSGRLVERGIEHRVLNAKNHEAEAAIIAEAGRVGAVTVATNMAGRGVDIKLGGAAAAESSLRDGVARLGGLCVIGTERHESRRVDDQLRGRAGRQGDPGESVFYVSVEDDLVVKHGPTPGWLPRAPGRLRRAVEVAQSNVEIRNRGLRAATHEYDEILDNHYSAICRFRRDVVDGSGFERWTTKLLERYLAGDVRLTDAGGRADVLQRFEAQRVRAGASWGTVQRHVMFAVVERGWSSVLETMRQLRNWVNLVALGGTYPITEWRHRSDAAVAAMSRNTEIEYLRQLLGAEIIPGPRPTLAVEMEPVGSHDRVAAAPDRRPELPAAAPHTPAYKAPIIPDWAEGFAGPTLQEVVLVVDASGVASGDGVSLVHRGRDAMTIYIDPENP